MRGKILEILEGIKGDNIKYSCKVNGKHHFPDWEQFDEFGYVKIGNKKKYGKEICADKILKLFKL